MPPAPKPTSTLDLEYAKRLARAANAGAGDQYLLHLIGQACRAEPAQREPILARIAALLELSDLIDPQGQGFPIRRPRGVITAADYPSVTKTDMDDT